MSSKYYALVGNHKMAPGFRQGISVYSYDPETAGMEKIGDHAEDLKVGAQTYDPARGIVYAVDEYWSLEGRTGGGGHVASLALDPATGELRRTSIQRTFGTNPSYSAFDRTGRFLLVTHHCTDRFVTRLVKTRGGYTSETYYDKCTLLLFELDESGEIGRIADVFEVPGEEGPQGHIFPHLHCVVPDQGRDYFMVCDKGLDKVYSFKIDYAAKKLVKCCEVEGKPGSAPRYGNFHPTKPLFCSNCEECPDVNIYALDTADGTFRRIGGCQSVGPELAGDVVPSDIVVHPSGEYIFTSLRRRDLISVLKVTGEDTLELLETVPSGGENPRGLCVSPDGRFLLAANVQSGTVTVFTIGGDGRLTPSHTIETGGFPGNIQIVRVQVDE